MRETQTIDTFGVSSDSFVLGVDIFGTVSLFYSTIAGIYFIRQQKKKSFVYLATKQGGREGGREGEREGRKREGQREKGKREGGTEGELRGRRTRGL